MKTILELEKLGYKVENYEGIVFRIKNSYGDLICSVFVRSGFCLLNEGKVFNYFTDVKNAIKKEGVNKFLCLYN